jgi:sortase A
MTERHLPRHRANEDDETTVLPRVTDDDVPDDDVAGEDAGRTGILPIFLPSTHLPATPGADDDTQVAAYSAVPASDADPDPDPAPVPSRTRGDVVRLFARSAGELLLTFGVVVLLLAAYEIWGKGAMIHAHQNDLNNQLSQDWGNPTVGPSADTAPGAPPPGWAIGRLYIPRLNLHLVVVEGVDLKDLRFAPGHYPGTALPGKVGNFAVAGHREPGMFWDLDKVRDGDYLIMETRTTWYVYQVFQTHIVSPNAVQVVAAVPNQPGVQPTQKDMTLTTCNPKWDNYQRLIVHAQMVATYPHSQRPSQLGGGT